MDDASFESSKDLSETALMFWLTEIEDIRLLSEKPFDRYKFSQELRRLLDSEYKDERILYMLLRNWGSLCDQPVELKDVYRHLEDPRPIVRIAVYRALRNVISYRKLQDESLAKHLVSVLMGLARQTDSTSLALEIQALAVLVFLVPQRKKGLLDTYGQKRSPLLLRQLMQAIEGK